MQFFKQLSLLPLLLLMLHSILEAQNLHTIIQKQSIAIGGQKGWENVTSYKIVMESTKETGRYQITSTMLWPNKFRLDFVNPKEILVKSFDGSQGWVAKNGDVFPMPEGEGGSFKGIYFKTRLKDYQKYDDIYLPAQMEFYADNELMRSYKVVSVIINPEIHENYFNRPNPWLNEKLKSRLEQFDFWLGEWEVYNYGTDELVGRSKIDKVAGGFGIEETFYGIPGPFHGKSLNKYNFFKRQWEQLWIDNSGMSHMFAGEYDEESGKMKLIKEEKQGDILWHHELTYEKLADGSVRQIWRKTKDKVEWVLNFDGQYLKRK